MYSCLLYKEHHSSMYAVPSLARCPTVVKFYSQFLIFCQSFCTYMALFLSVTNNHFGPISYCPCSALFSFIIFDDILKIYFHNLRPSLYIFFAIPKRFSYFLSSSVVLSLFLHHVVINNSPCRLLYNFATRSHISHCTVSCLVIVTSNFSLTFLYIVIYYYLVNRFYYCFQITQLLQGRATFTLLIVTIYFVTYSL